MPARSIDRRAERGIFPAMTDNPATARLAVDIGGTFTDLALTWQGRLFTAKLLTTAQAPDQAVMSGIGQILAIAGLAPSDLGIIIHGTTLDTNALIERKGAKTAFLTTAGFRDVLETGYEKRFEQYDVFMDKPPPLVPRHLRFPVPERMAPDGEVIDPLDEGAVRALAKTLAEEGIEAVAIGCLHSYANPAHEQRIRDLLLARCRSGGNAVQDSWIRYPCQTDR